MATTAAPMSTAAIAGEYRFILPRGPTWTQTIPLFAGDIVSIESMGDEEMPKEMKGIDAVRQKNQWWSENNQVHSASVDGPYLADGKFAVYYNFDVTFTPTGQRNKMEEVALYSVSNGKVVREQFFYNPNR